MSVENLIGVFTVLLTISFAAERLIEVGKPLFELIKSVTWRASAKLLSAIVIGTGVAALFRFEILPKMDIEAPYLLGYLAAGLIASTGSTTINRLLEWLKTLRNDPKITTTKTRYIDESNNNTGSSYEEEVVTTTSKVVQ
jgi:hypothetical protein